MRRCSSTLSNGSPSTIDAISLLLRWGSLDSLLSGCVISATGALTSAYRVVGMADVGRRLQVKTLRFM